jgi:hypothetical protein
VERSILFDDPTYFLFRPEINNMLPRDDLAAKLDCFGDDKNVVGFEPEKLHW